MGLREAWKLGHLRAATQEQFVFSILCRVYVYSTIVLGFATITAVRAHWYPQALLFIGLGISHFFVSKGYRKLVQS